MQYIIINYSHRVVHYIPWLTHSITGYLYLLTLFKDLPHFPPCAAINQLSVSLEDSFLTPSADTSDKKIQSNLNAKQSLGSFFSFLIDHKTERSGLGKGKRKGRVTTLERENWKMGLGDPRAGGKGNVLHLEMTPGEYTVHVWPSVDTCHVTSHRQTSYSPDFWTPGIFY